MKTVNKIIGGKPINVGSIKVQELLPNNGEFLSPFLVFHHGIAKIEQHIPIAKQGVGPHPPVGLVPSVLYIKVVFTIGIAEAITTKYMLVAHNGRVQALASYTANVYQKTYLSMAVNKKCYKFGLIHLRLTKWINQHIILQLRKKPQQLKPMMA